VTANLDAARRELMSMRRLIATEWTTLDGVIQAPGHPDEDRDGGFEHGGWHLPYFDDISRAWVVEGYAEAGGFVFGRRTYESLAAYWPNASEEEQVIAIPLNTKPKYVASTTLTAPLEWENSTLLDGDVAEAVAALKQAEGNDLHVVGSSALVHALLEHDLVDGVPVDDRPDRARGRQAPVPRWWLPTFPTTRGQPGDDHWRHARDVPANLLKLALESDRRHGFALGRSLVSNTCSRWRPHRAPSIVRGESALAHPLSSGD
jgi:dihydrofolate reductase